MSNYIRANRTRLLNYRLLQAAEALKDVKAMFLSTEYETQLNDLNAYLIWCAHVAETHVQEDMK